MCCVLSIIHYIHMNVSCFNFSVQEINFESEKETKNCVFVVVWVCRQFKMWYPFFNPFRIAFFVVIFLCVCVEERFLLWNTETMNHLIIYDCNDGGITLHRHKVNDIFFPLSFIIRAKHIYRVTCNNRLIIHSAVQLFSTYCRMWMWICGTNRHNFRINLVIFNFTNALPLPSAHHSASTL